MKLESEKSVVDFLVARIGIRVPYSVKKTKKATATEPQLSASEEEEGDSGFEFMPEEGGEDDMPDEKDYVMSNVKVSDIIKIEEKDLEKDDADIQRKYRIQVIEYQGNQFAVRCM